MAVSQFSTPAFFELNKIAQQATVPLQERGREEWVVLTDLPLFVDIGKCAVYTCSDACCTESKDKRRNEFFLHAKIPKTWTDAQSHCRSKYTDLSTVQTEKQLADLNELIGSDEYFWIGLYPDTGSWRWSLENQTYYGAGKADFRMWNPGEPNSGPSYYKVGVAMMSSDRWADVECNDTFPFVCYGGLAENQNIIFVNQPMTWIDAQSYDLASVTNQAENNQIRTMIPIHAARKLVVQVELEKTDSSVDMEELKEDILQWVMVVVLEGLWTYTGLIAGFEAPLSPGYTRSGTAGGG
ncbi:hypothetical protein Q8A73_016812 [Channa argus]|nr:hypothetical protein Q8A73_016812 [Channa argus]